jgi:predicted DsbA family dithiol-disulfide isomerase
MEVIDVNAENTETTENIRKYDITAVPSIVIDGRIKVVGIPNFPWFWAKSFTNF